MKGKNMKKFFCLLVTMIFVAVTVAQAQDKNKSVVTEISAEETEYDFGTIKEVNGPVSHVFKVKNTGKAPLVIVRVAASCGCTKPEFDAEPIAPGKEGKIKVTYNPAGRPGQFVKTISVYSNGKDGAFILRIKGVVE